MDRYAFGCSALQRPDSWSRCFAAILNAGQRPFYVINYPGSCGGGQALPAARSSVDLQYLADDAVDRCCTVECVRK